MKLAIGWGWRDGGNLQSAEFERCPGSLSTIPARPIASRKLVRNRELPPADQQV